MSDISKPSASRSSLHQSSLYVPILIRIFWQLGGANVDFLSKCPNDEHSKYTMLGLLVLLLAGGVATLTSFLAYLAALDRFGIEFILLPSAAALFSGFLVFVLTAALLSSSIRANSKISLRNEEKL